MVVVDHSIEKRMSTSMAEIASARFFASVEAGGRAMEEIVSREVSVKDCHWHAREVVSQLCCISCFACRFVLCDVKLDVLFLQLGYFAEASRVFVGSAMSWVEAEKAALSGEVGRLRAELIVEAQRHEVA
jgi:hypothetical protein